MKSLVHAIANRDGDALRKMGKVKKKPVAAVTDDTVRIFNELFRQLRAAFPATSAQFKDQDAFDELRRQWLLAFVENGITSMEQVSRGMSIARQQATPFLPSPGQFIAWCNGAAIDTRLPDAQTLFDMVMTYSATRFEHENYPWPDNACYWMVTRLFDQMRDQNLSAGELRRRCQDELVAMSKRLAAGDEPPAPVMLIPHHYQPVSRERGGEHLAAIRAMLKRGRA